jgi:hypothetical protein
MSSVPMDFITVPHERLPMPPAVAQHLDDEHLAKREPKAPVLAYGTASRGGKTDARRRRSV